MTWAQKQRLEYMLRQLKAAGRFVREDVRKVFDVSLPTVSGDLARFEEVYPGAARYDPSAKAYLPGHRLEEHLATVEAAS